MLSKYYGIIDLFLIKCINHNIFPRMVSYIGFYLHLVAKIYVLDFHDSLNSKVFFENGYGLQQLLYLILIIASRDLQQIFH